MQDNNNLDMLDMLSIFNTVVGMSNMKKNIIAQEHIEDIHNHILDVEKKLDYIIEMLEGGKNKNE